MRAHITSYHFLTRFPLNGSCVAIPQEGSKVEKVDVTICHSIAKTCETPKKSKRRQDHKIEKIVGEYQYRLGEVTESTFYICQTLLEFA